MKVWTKVYIKERSRQIDIISDSLLNYIMGYGPINDIYRKYKIEPEDRKLIEEYSLNRVAGLLMLYLAKDTKRINDIINKYNVPDKIRDNILPEIEGYIEK